MRIAIVGQRDFGKAVLEAFVARRDTVAAVFCAPEKPGTAADPLRLAAEQLGIRVYQFASLKAEEAHQALRALDTDLGVMAYVLQFAPQEFATIPRHGMIQYHPSLLPRYRGPSSINWPIIRGDTRTGLTIFRPTDGLDEGPILLQKDTPIGSDDTLGSVYFDRLFPMGIAALQEAADLVVNHGAVGRVQDESQASYEGWCRDPEARVNWHNHIDLVHNLIRGCDPAPAAWTTFKGKKLQLHGARKHPVQRFEQVKGGIGTVTAIGEQGVCVGVQGGQIEIAKLRYDGGKKLPAAQLCSEIGVSVGAKFGE
ncbi:MAG: methionyl-tRNA formyltransferase [Steroidobacteraceae bacterium]